MILKAKRYPFYVYITALIVAIVMILSGLFLYISHRESKVAAIHIANRLFSEINTKTSERYENALESVAVLAGSIARMPGMATSPVGDGLSHPGLELMLEALAFYEYIFSTYIGYDDGSFIQVIAVRDQPAFRRLFDAPPGTAFVLRTISIDTGGRLKQRWHFLDWKKQVTGERDDMDRGFDPRTRPWYLKAQKEQTAYYTEPYVFSSTKLAGITCAEKLSSGGGVFGADITLDRLSLSLEQQKVSENSILFLFDQSGRIIAHATENPIKAGIGKPFEFLTAKEFGDPLVQAVVADYQDDPDGKINRTREIQINRATYLVRLTRLKTGLKFDKILASIAPASDFTGHIHRMQQRILIFSGLVLLVVLPLAFIGSLKISGALTQLEQESIKIQQRDFTESAPFGSRIKEIHSLIKAFVLMKSTIQRLLEQQRKLFDDFTKLIAGAIDAKSPYTGGHCTRVPRLAAMLVKAACKAEEGVFADFSMDTEDERWEFEVAAWLHDCGKVTTPEYVVDKATKLETIYNRIHEIRMRFEVLLRDAEIDYYRKLLAGSPDRETLQAELEKTQKQIADDFEFVASCNIGGEFMPDDKIERLKQIANQTWLRHLDDRLGISQDEAALKNLQSTPTLPAVEYVLADKPEHIIPRTNTDPVDDNSYGFKMTAPEDQYNLGELYNLCIRKGTLAPEDRFKINEHIIQTIIMLNKLEFPEYLAKVPEFAGAHHETMIGTGYPRGLKKEEMSIPARMLAIADIFEALTATDRPYKKPKTLNESLRIMSFMSKDQHIDADLFDLFLKSGVYQEYADQYMDSAQIDAVDIYQYLSKVNP